MKKSVIKQVFNGARGTGESVKSTKELEECVSALSDIYNEFIIMLSPDQVKVLERYEKVMSDMQVEEVNINYIEGFKLGLLIGIECMDY